MQKPELLSPAGSMESLYAAIQGGCDAVYLAGNLYGARSYAANFNKEELKQAVMLCHLYGIKVYVTINTLIYEAEVKNFMKYVEYLQSIDVDAVIMQDIGMMDLVHQTFPQLEIHASTQMHIHNLEGVRLLEKMGIKRAVLARETPIELVQNIKKESHIALEIFIHGALCISYSGQCLMSSLIGGRSGNRGTCAQSCRQPYELLADGKKVNQQDYLLSTKDLNTLDFIPKLIDCGIDSLKIEGRMKRPEYVYLITSIYRKAIDSYCATGTLEITETDKEEIKKIFHRGFTKGFLFHEENNSFTNEYRPNHMGIPIGTVIDQKHGMLTMKLTSSLHVGDGIRILGVHEDTGKEVDVIYSHKNKVVEASKGDIITIPYRDNVALESLVLKTTDYLQLDRLSKNIKQGLRKVPLTFSFYAYIGKPMSMVVEDGTHKIEVTSDYVVQESKNAPISPSRIKEQLEKMGGTVYCLDKVNWYMDDSIFIPVQKLNDLRRQAVDAISKKRLYHTSKAKANYHRDVPNFPITREKTVYVKTLEEWKKIEKKNYDFIYVEENLYRENDCRLILKVPRVQEVVGDYHVPLLIGELGSLNRYPNSVADFSFNVVNSYSVAFLHAMGIQKVTLSYELNMAQIKNLITAYQERYQKHPCLELIVSGKIEAMISKYRLLSKYAVQTKKCFLVDKYHNQFPVEEKGGFLYIYHYQNQSITNFNDYYDMGINSLRDSF